MWASPSIATEISSLRSAVRLQSDSNIQSRSQADIQAMLLFYCALPPHPGSYSFPEFYQKHKHLLIKCCEAWGPHPGMFTKKENTPKFNMNFAFKSTLKKHKLPRTNPGDAILCEYSCVWTLWTGNWWPWGGLANRKKKNLRWDAKKLPS